MGFDSQLNDLSNAAERSLRLTAHPSASGNISVMLSELPQSGMYDDGEWKAIKGNTLTQLKGNHCLITATGEHVFNVVDQTKRAAGIIAIHEDGKQIRPVWGFERPDGTSGRETSEADTHLQIHNVIDSPESGVVHGHPIESCSLMSGGVITNEVQANKVAWRVPQEGSDYLKGGVGFMDWRCSGDAETGILTSENIENGRDGVLWDLHGLVTHGTTLDQAIGRTETFEHACATAGKALERTGRVRMLSTSQIRKLMAHFGFEPSEEVLAMLVEEEEKQKRKDKDRKHKKKAKYIYG